jgi:hypothetical protein
MSGTCKWNIRGVDAVIHLAALSREWIVTQRFQR